MAERDSKRIAFEIKTGKSDAVANVKKCLDAGFNRVVVVATSAPVRDKIWRILPKDSSIKLVTASELLMQSR